MTRRGIILAGGAGTRLHPLTLAMSKQLLPIYDKPMIYYPLATLMLAGIRDILVITSPDDAASFQRLLGDGSQWGIAIQYAVQEQPDGLAQALVIGREFLAGRPCCLVLGDNLLYGHGLPDVLREAARREEGATIFGYQVEDPDRYGIVQFGAGDVVTALQEKPERPESNWAVIGLYFYDGTAAERATALQRSTRGEFEITDLNKTYLRDGRLHLQRLGRGFAWFDAGVHAALLEAAEFVHVLQRRQGQLVAAPEEIAYNSGWINAEQLLRLAARLGKTEYGRKIAALVT